MADSDITIEILKGIRGTDGRDVVEIAARVSDLETRVGKLETR